MAKISADARRELVQAIGERYRSGSRAEKLRILDEFVAVTGYHRKHSIRLLRARPPAPGSARRPRLRVYDDAVREALVVLWEASDRVCGKRLKALLPLLVPSLERHGHLHLDEGVRAKLLATSASTIDRLLAVPRGAVEGRPSRLKAKPAIRRSIPVRTFADWNGPLPGFMEADLVSHGGDNVAGSFAHTLVLTDIATGWTECVALAVREGCRFHHDSTWTATEWSGSLSSAVTSALCSPLRQSYHCGSRFLTDFVGPGTASLSGMAPVCCPRLTQASTHCTARWAWSGWRTRRTGTTSTPPRRCSRPGRRRRWRSGGT